VVRRLEQALGADVYDDESIENGLWAIRRNRGPQGNDVLAEQASDVRLSREHPALVALFVEYRRQTKVPLGPLIRRRRRAATICVYPTLTHGGVLSLGNAEVIENFAARWGMIVHTPGM